MSRDSMLRFTAALAPASDTHGARVAGRRPATARPWRSAPAARAMVKRITPQPVAALTAARAAARAATLTAALRAAPIFALPRAVILALILAVTLTVGPTAALAQGKRPATGEQPVPSQTVPAEKTPADMDNRTTSMMAQGLFDGDRLTAEAEARLTDFIIDSVGRQVEIALIIPRGPWVVEGGIQDERSMTPARLNAIRNFLAQRGIDRDRIVVESRIDEKLAEPRLDVQVITREPRD